MNMRASIEAFLWAIVVGAGFRIGWGLIELIVDVAQKAIK